MTKGNGSRSGAVHDVERCRHEGPAVQHGVAAVELVLILPLMLAVLLGTIAIGAAYYQKLGLTEGAREGARYGATLRTGVPGDVDRTGHPTAGWFEEIAWTATQTASDWDTVCVSYTGFIARRPTGNTITGTLQQTNGGSPAITLSGASPCFTDGRAAQGNEGRVQVMMTGTAPFDNFFFFRRTLVLEGSSVARFERPYTAVDN